MGQKMSLKEMEKKAYVLYHEDGLLDICAGSCVLFFGLLVVLSRFYFLSIVVPIIGAFLGSAVSLLWIKAKKKITVPRVGFVKFGALDMRRFLTVILIFLVLMIGLLVFGLLALQVGGVWFYWSRLISQYNLILLGMFVAVAISLLAWLFWLRRFYGYALATWAMFIVEYFIGVNVVFLSSFLGAIFLAGGVFRLTQFLRKYPLQPVVTE